MSYRFVYPDADGKVKLPEFDPLNPAFPIVVRRKKIPFALMPDVKNLFSSITHEKLNGGK